MHAEDGEVWGVACFVLLFCFFLGLSLLLHSAGNSWRELQHQYLDKGSQPHLHLQDRALGVFKAIFPVSRLISKVCRNRSPGSSVGYSIHSLSSCQEAFNDTYLTFSFVMLKSKQTRWQVSLQKPDKTY